MDFENRKLFASILHAFIYLPLKVDFPASHACCEWMLSLNISFVLRVFEGICIQEAKECITSKESINA